VTALVSNNSINTKSKLTVMQQTNGRCGIYATAVGRYSHSARIQRLTTEV